MFNQIFYQSFNGHKNICSLVLPFCLRLFSRSPPLSVSSSAALPLSRTAGKFGTIDVYLASCAAFQLDRRATRKRRGEIERKREGKERKKKNTGRERATPEPTFRRIDREVEIANRYDRPTGAYGAALIHEAHKSERSPTERERISLCRDIALQ